MGSSLSNALSHALQSWGYAVGCWSAFALALAISPKLRRRLAADRAEALIWAAVLSVFLAFGVEQLNAQLPRWTHLGLPFAEPWRTAAQGLSFAAMIPTVLAAAFLCKAAEVSPPPPPRFLYAVAAVLAVGAALLRTQTLDGATVLALAGLFAAVDVWNGRADRPSLLASLWSGAPRMPVAVTLGAAAWVAADRLASSVAPPGRIYTGFSSSFWLWPVLALQALVVWSCYVAAAAWLDRPLLLLDHDCKEELKIFG